MLVLKYLFKNKNETITQSKEINFGKSLHRVHPRATKIKTIEYFSSFFLLCYDTDSFHFSCKGSCTREKKGAESRTPQSRSSFPGRMYPKFLVNPAE